METVLPIIIIGGILLFFVLRIFIFGGIKNSLFGAKITKTIGTVEATCVLSSVTRLKIHRLQRSKKPRDIGIEFIKKNGPNITIAPISLSNSQARKLIMLLEIAINEKTHNKNDPADQ